jgi:hypothetical protein
VLELPCRLRLYFLQLLCRSGRIVIRALSRCRLERTTCAAGEIVWTIPATVKWAAGERAQVGRRPSRDLAAKWQLRRTRLALCRVASATPHSPNGQRFALRREWSAVNYAYLTLTRSDLICIKTSWPLVSTRRKTIALGAMTISERRGSQPLHPGRANLNIVKRFELPMAAITKCLNVARHSQYATSRC